MTTIPVSREVLGQVLDLLEKLESYCGHTSKSASALRAAMASPPQAEPVAWLPIETAPKDGTMLRLLVEFEDHATEDTDQPCPTIGANSLKNTEIDEWLFAGWSWQQDCFTQGVGKPIGWLPMLASPPTQPTRRPVHPAGAIDDYGPDSAGCCGATVVQRCPGCPHDKPAAQVAPLTDEREAFEAWRATNQTWAVSTENLMFQAWQARATLYAEHSKGTT